MSIVSVIVAIISVTIVYFYLKTRRSRNLIAKLPTADGKIPIIGNLLQLKHHSKDLATVFYETLQHNADKFVNERIYAFHMGKKVHMH